MYVHIVYNKCLWFINNNPRGIASLHPTTLKVHDVKENTNLLSNKPALNGVQF